MAVKLSISKKLNGQSAATNKSNITVSVIAQWSGGSYNTLQKPGTLTIDGVPYDFTSSFNEKQTSSGTKTLFTKTVDIQHDSEGRKKLTIKATYSTGVSSGDISASIVEDLPKIALASSVAATDAYIGAVSMVAITKRAAAYKHSVGFVFGSRSGWLAADGSISDTEVIMSETSVPFTLPDNFHKEIPNAASGTCTLTCTTYSGSTVIGSATTAKFKASANAALVTPSVSAEVTDANSRTFAVTGDESKMVRYMSDAKCTLQGTMTWFGATIKESRIGGVVVDANERTISGIETNSVEFRVKDSRGLAGTETVEFELVPYVRLTCAVTASRVDPIAGISTLELSGNYYNGSFGARDNTLAIQYSLNGGDPATVEATLSGDTYAATVQLEDLDYRTGYTADVTVSDALDSITKSVEVGPSIPAFCYNAKGFKFNVPVIFSDGSATELADRLKSLSAAGVNTVRLYGTYEVSANIPIPGDMTIIGGTFVTTPEFEGTIFTARGDNVRLIGVTMRAPAHDKTPEIFVTNNQETDALCSNVRGLYSNEHDGIALINCICDKIIPGKLNRGHIRIQGCRITDAPMFVWSTGAKITAIDNDVTICDTGLDYYYHVYYCDGDAELLAINNRIRCDVSTPFFDVYHLMTAGNKGEHFATGIIKGDVVSGNFQRIIDCHYADLTLGGCTIRNTNTGEWQEFSNTAHSRFAYHDCTLDYANASEQIYDSSMSEWVRYDNCRITKNAHLNRRAIYNRCHIEQELDETNQNANTVLVNMLDIIDSELVLRGTPQAIGIASSGTLVANFIGNTVRFEGQNTSPYLFNYAGITGVIANNVVIDAADGTTVWRTDRGNAHNNIINGGMA